MTIIIAVLATSVGKAAEAFEFRGKRFFIQSALEAGRSANGYWGFNEKNDLRGSFPDSYIMSVWKIGSENSGVREFLICPKGKVGRYSIFCSSPQKENILAVCRDNSSGRVTAGLRINAFRLKYLGSGKWKIYAKPGVVVCLEKPTAVNGTKLVLRPDTGMKTAEWVFYGSQTMRMLMPDEAIQITAGDDILLHAGK